MQQNSKQSTPQTACHSKDKNGDKNKKTFHISRHSECMKTICFIDVLCISGALLPVLPQPHPNQMVG